MVQFTILKVLDSPIGELNQFVFIFNMELEVVVVRLRDSKGELLKEFNQEAYTCYIKSFEEAEQWIETYMRRIYNESNSL